MAATVEIVYRKDKKNNKGEAPIYIRIIKNRRVNYIATGYRLIQRHWDDNLRRVRRSFPNSVRLNHLLSTLKNKYQDEVLHAETKDLSISARVLKRRINGDPNTDFFQVAEALINTYKVDRKTRTYKKAESIIQKLKSFCKTKSLQFEEITPQFLSKYELYLKTKLNNKINTIDKDMRFIRRVFNEAYALEVVNIRSPFEKYKLKKEKTERLYLTEEELGKLESVSLPIGSQSSLYRDLFVFSSYAGGLRISDLLLLRWGNFDGTHINFKVQKTGSQLSIKLPEKAKAIVLKYYSKELESQRFVFPILKNSLKDSDIEETNRAISSATAYINKKLKEIAKLAKVDKNVSTHIARHTWATRALRLGISIDKVSKVMGHAAIKETQIYAKIVSEDMDRAMDNFND